MRISSYICLYNWKNNQIRVLTVSLGYMTLEQWISEDNIRRCLCVKKCKLSFRCFKLSSVMYVMIIILNYKVRCWTNFWTHRKHEHRTYYYHYHYSHSHVEKTDCCFFVIIVKYWYVVDTVNSFHFVGH